MRGSAPTRPSEPSLLVTAVLLLVGALSTAYAWRIRQPLTTADFTLFYRSAALPPERMYEPPPGRPRNNMNPPQFQLALRPLTTLPLETASIVFRALSVGCLCVCIAVLWRASRESGEPWTAADLGALLAWTPMTAMISLNQVAWIIWPLLLLTWWCWRRERWTAGAIAFGIALGVKPFLGVILLWLLVSGRTRATLVAAAAAAASYGVAVAVYGTSVLRTWVNAMGDIAWWWVAMNASLEGCLARALTPIGIPTTTLPAGVSTLSLIGGAIVVALTLVRLRDRTVDESWPALVAASLMASPLGWVYYAWWMLPGTRPWRVLLRAPMLWIPLAYVAVMPANRLQAATLGSAYFWGLTTFWVMELRTRKG